MKRKTLRNRITYGIPILASIAFLVGVVRVGDVPAEKILSVLIVAIAMVAGLALLAFITVAISKGIGKWLGK